MPSERLDVPPELEQLVDTAARCGFLYLQRFPEYIRQKLQPDLNKLAVVAALRYTNNYGRILRVGLIYTVMRNLIIDLLRRYGAREKNEVQWPENFEYTDPYSEQHATGLTTQQLLDRYRICLRELRQETLNQLNAEKGEVKSSRAAVEKLQNRLDLLDWLEQSYDTSGQQQEMRQKDIALTYERSEATICTELKTIRLLLRTRVLMNPDNADTVAYLPLPPDSSDSYSDAYESWQCYDGKNQDVTLHEGGLLTVVRISESSVEIADSAWRRSEVVRGTVLVNWQHDQLPPGEPNLVNVTWQKHAVSDNNQSFFSSAGSAWGLPVVLQPNAQTPVGRANLNLHYSGRRNSPVDPGTHRQKGETVPYLTVRCSVICE